MECLIPTFNPHCRLVEAVSGTRVTWYLRYRYCLVFVGLYLIDYQKTQLSNRKMWFKQVMLPEKVMQCTVGMQSTVQSNEHVRKSAGHCFPLLQLKPMMNKTIENNIIDTRFEGKEYRIVRSVASVREIYGWLNIGHRPRKSAKE